MNIHAFLLLVIILGLEISQSTHHRLIRFTKHLLDLMHAESTPGCVILRILDIKHVQVVRLLLLRRAQIEELGAVHAHCGRIEVVAEELEELGQILAQRTAVINPEPLQEGARHQHDGVGIEST